MGACATRSHFRSRLAEGGTLLGERGRATSRAVLRVGSRVSSYSTVAVVSGECSAVWRSEKLWPWILEGSRETPADCRAVVAPAREGSWRAKRSGRRGEKRSSPLPLVPARLYLSAGPARLSTHGSVKGQGREGFPRGSRATVARVMAPPAFARVCRNSRHFDALAAMGTGLLRSPDFIELRAISICDNGIIEESNRFFPSGTFGLDRCLSICKHQLCVAKTGLQRGADGERLSGRSMRADRSRRGTFTSTSIARTVRESTDYFSGTPNRVRFTTP